jgi:hypothetical protein
MMAIFDKEIIILSASNPILCKIGPFEKNDPELEIGIPK